MNVHPTPMIHLNAQEDGTAGSADTFESFFAATNPRLFTALWLVTGDRYEAEEIAQDAFLRVFERWERVGTLENPESYVFRTAMNVFRNRYRRAALALRRSLSLAPEASDELAAVEDRDEVIRLLQPHEGKMSRDVRLANNYFEALFQSRQIDKVTKLLNALAGSPNREVKQFAIERSRMVAQFLQQQQAQLAQSMQQQQQRKA